MVDPMLVSVSAASVDDDIGFLVSPLPHTLSTTDDDVVALVGPPPGVILCRGWSGSVASSLAHVIG